eukprot:COSAG02_NODE_21655_length_780_cov_0.745962_1_plen_96_part_10
MTGSAEPDAEAEAAAEAARRRVRLLEHQIDRLRLLLPKRTQRHPKLVRSHPVAFYLQQLTRAHRHTHAQCLYTRSPPSPSNKCSQLALAIHSLSIK